MSMGSLWLHVVIVTISIAVYAQEDSPCDDACRKRVQVFLIDDFYGMYKKIEKNCSLNLPSTLQISPIDRGVRVSQKIFSIFFKYEDWSLDPTCIDETDTTMRDRGWNYMSQHQVYLVADRLILFQIGHMENNCIATYVRTNDKVKRLKEMILSSDGEVLTYVTPKGRCSYKKQ